MENNTEARITPEVGKRMLSWAFKYLAEKRNEINAVNVFPVPDKDTGDNMLSGVRGAYRRVKDKSYDYSAEGRTSFYADLQKGLLRGAHGNAGVISSSYLQKFFKWLFMSETCSQTALIAAFEAGADGACRAVQEPMEGTILDVVKAAHTAAYGEHTENLREIFDAAVLGAEKELPKTKERMLILKEADVVDAGAMGFVVLLTGLRDGFFSNEMPELPKDILGGRIDSFIDDIDPNDPELQTYPYEVQAIVELYERAKREEFEQGFAKFGVRQDFFWLDDDSQGRVHVHTSDVEKVQRYVEKYGDVFDVLVVDMRVEVQALRGEKRKVWIVTDGVELPWNTMKEGIYSVPFELDFPEGEGMEGDIYSKILRAKTRPITSQPPPESYRERIEEKALKVADEILVITISSQLSGSYNSALSAREDFGEDDRKKVTVFDSGQASCGQALLAHKALELAREGKSMFEILGNLDEIKGRIRLFGYPLDVEYLIRSGRIEEGSDLARKARKIQKIGLHPKLTLYNGVIERAGIGFGNLAINLWLTILSEFFLSKIKGKHVNCAISYGGMASQERLLRTLLKPLKNFGLRITSSEPLNRIIGVRTGPALLIAWYEE